MTKGIAHSDRSLSLGTLLCRLQKLGYTVTFGDRENDMLITVENNVYISSVQWRMTGSRSTRSVDESLVKAIWYAIDHMQQKPNVKIPISTQH